ncbi:signal peptidase I [Rathayibacter soli]|uniref:signal peptidase I n=1 Tax=Rathayibacter soli TaxID=3144168 RepID=UPI0027E4E046|nr:signal peptidase I [Glaciibacter superstes]
MSGGEQRRTRRRGISPWWHLLTALVVLALVQSFLVKLYQVPSGSMEQTLQVGDRILVNRLAYLGSEPARGDVVVFAGDQAWGLAAHSQPFSIVTAVKWVGGLFGIGPGTDYTLVKRVIGQPGDTVACCDAQGRVQVNGKPLAEPYVYQNSAFQPGVLDCSTKPASTRCFGSILVPQGEYLVLGDHRSDSDDSVAACRGSTDAPPGCARFVPGKQVVGRAFFVALPPGRFGSVG